MTAEFTTGPDTHFLEVHLRRTASRLFENRLSGTVWVADVYLIPAESMRSLLRNEHRSQRTTADVMAFAVFAFGAVEVWAQSISEIAAALLFFAGRFAFSAMRT